MPEPKTLLDKLWDAHVVANEPGCPDVLYVDLHLLHEVTSPQAFAELAGRGLAVRRPERCLATMDHATPTTPGLPSGDRAAMTQLETLAANCRRHGIVLHAVGESGNGVAHVIAPECGHTRPGMTIACGDSHTSTHGAFGALAFGIGTSEVAQVLATQCLLQYRPQPMEVAVTGRLAPGVTAKDLALAVIARIGAAGGTGCAIEYRGAAVAALSMEGRMSLCNMSIEAGARAGMVAPDSTTLEYLRRRLTPAQYEQVEAQATCWQSDTGARFAKSAHLDAATLAPMVTWGTSPAQAAAVTGRVPEPANAADERALCYMKLAPGAAIAGTKVNAVFVGSCTNGRIEDLRAAAGLLRGRRVAPGVRVLVVPGSQRVKREAEAEGLAQVFAQAGAQWREPGCSMCIAMNGDSAAPGELVVSTSNRNFEGRQGPGVRTVLASPLTAAASAIAGCIADPRELERSQP
ncbi:MAG: 3-isopropylmalate dehydratase large subunit [Planctomycetes bacterium]|nr:3-isopropylmalate dehydratase large subunit [Planctomycetota bacterium]